VILKPEKYSGLNGIRTHNLGDTLFSVFAELWTNNFNSPLLKKKKTYVSKCILSDPYVKVSMIMGGKTLKKRKTVINKKTAFPVYNEAFVFTILPTCLDRVSFMLSVYTVPRLGGSKKLIGRAVVGPYMYSTGQGLAHWNDMIASPRSAVAQWHTLI